MKKRFVYHNISKAWALVVLLATFGCSNDDGGSSVDPIPEPTPGSADFSTYVSLGNSLTAGYTDAALFQAAQENSFPNMLAGQFEMFGGGDFTQPLTNDNYGGLAAGGTRIADPRLVTTGGFPQPLESVIGPVTVSTDIAVNNPTGPFNNMGVPGAASFHLLAPGYGNLANFPAAANPYFVRMTGATPDASVIELAMAQNPTFFSLWIGANDVLGFATSGGASGAITDQPMFDAAIGGLVQTLTSNGAKGVMANIPYVTTIPYFTTVPYNSVPLDANTAAVVNQGYAPYNGGLQQALMAGLISEEEVALRTIQFEASESNAVVIEDEGLTDLSALGLPNYRQANEGDLLVLTSASVIGTLADPNNPMSVIGVAVPLEDQWVLVPVEQDMISSAIDGFNATLKGAADQAGLAFVDANALMQELADSGIVEGNYVLTDDLVTGGVFSLDGVHLTARGYAVVANEFMKAIDATYGANFEASMNLLDIGNYPTNYSPTLQ